MKFIAINQEFRSYGRRIQKTEFRMGSEAGVGDLGRQRVV
jgi:hypothetical protein